MMANIPMLLIKVINQETHLNIGLFMLWSRLEAANATFSALVVVMLPVLTCPSC